MNTPALAVTAALLCFCTACSEAPRQAPEKKAAAEPFKGRAALFQMYSVARGWSPDLVVLNLHSISVEGVKEERGKAGAWQATFASRQAGRARSYTYSVVEAEGGLHKGVFAGQEESWAGPRGTQKPFLIGAVKTDSDEAFEVALKKGAEYDKNNPGKRISFVLEQSERFSNPAWRVIWGESAGTSDFSIFVDATSGTYLQTMR